MEGALFLYNQLVALERHPLTATRPGLLCTVTSCTCVASVFVTTRTLWPQQWWSH